jgi:hypothetical protein
MGQTRAVCLAADTMAYFSPLQTVAADYYISRRPTGLDLDPR